MIRTFHVRRVVRQSWVVLIDSETPPTRQQITEGVKEQLEVFIAHESIKTEAGVEYDFTTEAK